MNMYQKREQRKKKKSEDKSNVENTNKVNINWYPGHMAKAKRQISEQLNLIDLVYEVIDARMPYSSKIKDIDNLIKSKPRILIMTKMDLCDKKETDKWIKYYTNKGFNVIGMNLEGNTDIKPIIKLTEELMKKQNLKKEKLGMLKRKTRVLVIGIPNVGKSTLINRLVGRKAVVIGNRPGVTKQLNWIRINDNIELLDTPGILWPRLDNKKTAFNLASLSAIKEEILPIFEVVNYILNTLYKYYPQILLERYNISEIHEDISIDYETIGKKRGALVKGGLVDYDKVSNIVISDVRNNNIKNITFDRMDNYE